jgi:hypothetical protein
LPEERLIERIQQVRAHSRNLLSPSFVVVCRIFAAVFGNLRDIFVTAAEEPSVELGCVRFRDFPDADLNDVSKARQSITLSSSFFC